MALMLLETTLLETLALLRPQVTDWALPSECPKLHLAVHAGSEEGSLIVRVDGVDIRSAV